jgi:hypothetical protein
VTAGDDQAKPDEFMHHVIGFMSGSAACYGIRPVTNRGLYRVLADRGQRLRNRSRPC